MSRAQSSREPFVLLSLATIIGLLASAILWNLPLNNDVSWQYWVARQLRGGATFGGAVKEINPPLWFWEAMPISALADRFGVASAHLAVAAAVGRSMLTLILTGALLDSSAVRRLVILGGLAAALLILPIFDFGERDHFMLLGALPYAALIARRGEGGRPPARPLALAIGLLAALGFALKPYFLLVPFALELWLALRLRRGWRPVRVETIALAGAAIAYALAILAFTDHYLDGVLPIARYAYGDFSPPFVTLFTRQIYLPAWILAAVALTFARPRGAQAQAAGAATLAFLACYLIQRKGFAYHALPVTVGLVWTLWLALAERGNPLTAIRARPLAGLAILAAFATALFVGPFRAPSLGALDRTIARLPPGTVFAVISAHSWHAFPLVEQRGFVWPLSGAIALLPLPMILHEGTGPRATPRGRFVRQWTLDRLAEGFTACPPQAILVDDPDESTVVANHGADYLEFLRTDPRFAIILNRYKVLAAAGRQSLLVARQGELPSRSVCALPPLVGTAA